jgi:hypothetical protein
MLVCLLGNSGDFLLFSAFFFSQQAERATGWISYCRILLVPGLFRVAAVERLRRKLPYIACPVAGLLTC